MLKILMVPLLLLVAAQLPSCGGIGQIQQGPLVGFVDDKYIGGNEAGNPVPFIIIGASEYIVPMSFYRQVGIGDLVRWENGLWTIVRKASP